MISRGWMLIGLIMSWQTLNAEAQFHRVSGFLQDCGKDTLYLAQYYQDSYRIIDSVVLADGSFYFIFPESRHAGFYRIGTDRAGISEPDASRFRDFIYNEEDPVLYGSCKDLAKATVADSRENYLLQQYEAFEARYQDSLRRLYRFIGFYRHGNRDPKMEAYTTAYSDLQQQRVHYLDSLTSAHPGMYVSRYINAFRSPVLPGGMTHRERIDTLKACFFDAAPVNDPLLLYAPVYVYKINDFLRLFRSDTATFDQQQELFIEGVDRIMANVSHEPELRDFVVEYLLDGFESVGMETVQVYLVDHYVDETCTSDIVDLVLSRMEGYRALEPGRKAPDLVIRDAQGITRQLYNLDHDYLMVIFWASTCEHCQKLMPRLDAWYKAERDIDLEILAVSIDTTYAQFRSFADRYDFQWITACDTLGWEGPLAGTYYVYATPSVFLLDRDHVILDKPFTFREIMKAIRRLED